MRRFQVGLVVLGRPRFGRILMVIFKGSASRGQRSAPTLPLLCFRQRFGCGIFCDPIAARVIRVATSVLYGWGGQVDTVEKAVSIVGLNQIFELLTVAQSLESFQGIPPQMLDVRDFWRHSVV